MSIKFDNSVHYSSSETVKKKKTQQIIQQLFFPESSMYRNILLDVYLFVLGKTVFLNMFKHNDE